MGKSVRFVNFKVSQNHRTINISCIVTDHEKNKIICNLSSNINDCVLDQTRSTILCSKPEAPKAIVNFLYYGHNLRGFTRFGIKIKYGKANKLKYFVFL